MQSLSSSANRACVGSSRTSFTASRQVILAELPARVPRRAVAVQAGKGAAAGHVRVTPALLGAAVGLGLLAPGASIAMEEAAAPQISEVNIEAAAQPASLQLSSNMPVAPELVTDLDVEVAAHSDNPLMNGLGWMVEEGLEVTNFTESNFAAVGAPSSSMWLSNSPWCLVWDAYCNVLTQQPVATKLATGMVGTFLGDLLAQFTQGLVNTSSAAAATIRGRSRGSGQSGATAAGSSGFELNLGRTARLVGFSALVGTPVAFVWFNLLDQYVMPADPTNPLAVFSKVALDQVLMAPCMTSMFFATMAMLEGSRGAEVADTVKAKLKPTLLANWTVWPLAHVVNFALVPPAQRILYINVINIAWTAFMSHMASSSNSTEDTAAAEQREPAAVRNTSSRQLQQSSR